MLSSLVASVRGLWIRPEQSERVHDQNSPTSSTAAELEGDRSLAVDEVQVRVEVEEKAEAEPECTAARDEVPSSEHHRSSAEGEDELQQEQQEQQVEDESEISRLASGNSSESSTDICRVCQQQSEEPLIVLGCACRGGLARAHRSCIDAWFARKGSNKCEVCQEIATNVPPPPSEPGQFWVWRMGAGRNPRRGRVRFQPLWVALMILMAGLLFDILISIFLGASALPVNIIIGILIVLGVGTIFRLILECWRTRELRRLQRRHLRANPIYQSPNATGHEQNSFQESPGESPSQELGQLQRPGQVYAIVI